MIGRKLTLGTEITPFAGLETVAQQLEEEGVNKFIEPFDKLQVALEQRRQKQATEPV